VPKPEVLVNRAPVLTLWAAVVAERLGHPQGTALTLGKAVAGLNAQAKGRRLGIFEASKEPGGAPKPKAPLPEEAEVLPLLGRAVPVIHTPQGIRATLKDKPIDPESVQRYLEQKFGDDLAQVRAAMQALAKAYPPQDLAARAFALYEQFRPPVPEGQKGWGAKGVLDVNRIHALAKR